MTPLAHRRIEVGNGRQGELERQCVSHDRRRKGMFAGTFDASELLEHVVGLETV